MEIKKPALIGLILAGLALLVLIELRPWRETAGPEQAGKSSVEPAATPPGEVGKDGSKQGSSEPNQAQATQVGTSAGLDSEPIRAQLSPVTFTTITGELNARIQAIPKREGEFFSQGDVLIIYDCSAQRAQLQKSQAAMAIAERNFETNRQLLALQSVSKVEHDNSLSEFQKARAEVEELSAVISRCQTLAPFPGRVVEQRVRSQQFVQPGQPLLDILDDRSMELEFIAPSRWSPWLKAGYSFKIEIDETGKAYPARVTRVAARIDSVSQTFKVVAVISGSYRELSPGMSGTLIIQPPKSRNSN